MHPPPPQTPCSCSCCIQAQQAIAAFDTELAPLVCSAVQALLPSTCSVLSSAVIVGAPLPKHSSTDQLVAAGGIAQLAFQRQDDFMLLAPELHALYNAEVDAYHSSMTAAPRNAAASHHHFALLSLYVEPASGSAQPPGWRCCAAGALQVLLRLPASGAAGSMLCALDGSEESLLQLPVEMSRHQLLCLRSTASCVVGHVLLGCLASPHPEHAPPTAAIASPNDRLQRDSMSLIALAENVFALDVAADAPPSEESLLQKSSRVPQAAARASAAPASSKDAARKRSTLPQQLRAPHSPATVKPQQFSPDMSLRSELQLHVSPPNRSPALASSPSPLIVQPTTDGAQQHRAAPGAVLYVQDEDSAGAARPPIRRAKHNFLIPVYSSDED